MFFVIGRLTNAPASPIINKRLVQLSDTWRGVWADEGAAYLENQRGFGKPKAPEAAAQLTFWRFGGAIDRPVLTEILTKLNKRLPPENRG